MKNNVIIKALLFLFITAFIVSCKDGNDEPRVGVSGQSWVNQEPVEVNHETTSQVLFNAASSWSATSSGAWCRITPATGERGQNTIKLLASSYSTEERNATITITVKGYSPVTFNVVQKATTPTYDTADSEINKVVYNYLSEKYLWNEEYRLLDFDYSKDFEAFFEDPLMSMTTNTLDKKQDEDGSYSIYSYIEKLNPVSKTSVANKSRALLSKELEYSFGFTGLMPVLIGENEICFYVEGVYTDSPASGNEVKRGAAISKIDGATITRTSLYEQYMKLMHPTNVSSITITNLLDNNKETTLTSKAMYLNPVIFSKVETVDSKKIGYLVYSQFDASFDEELFNVFKDFKSKGVTDIILDLRYNGGGHTVAANLISTCIAGDKADGKVFASFRYNKERMAKLNNQREEELFSTSTYANLNKSLADGFLNLNKVYCLVSDRTASSSELVINSLRGIDVDVVLIGERTEGKNVGMEYIETTIKGDQYRIVPITFQIYNAKGEGDYEKGFEPDIRLEELTVESNRVTLKDYGSNDEVLYAKAVEEITGKKLSVASRSSKTNLFTCRPISVKKKTRLGFNAMLKEAND